MTKIKNSLERLMEMNNVIKWAHVLGMIIRSRHPYSCLSCVYIRYQEDVPSVKRSSFKHSTMYHSYSEFLLEAVTE